jgi:hypothetical protein
MAMTSEMVLSGQGAPARLRTCPARLLAEFSLHFNPVGPVEQILVHEAARRAAQMAEFDTALAALRQESEPALLAVLSSPSTDSAAAQQIATASVLGSARHEAIVRQGLASARGFGHAIRELDYYRSRTPADAWGNSLLIDPRFSTEPACYAHLVRRFVFGKCGCGACGAITQGSFISVRLCWQCGQCRAQTGLRVGTCTERSPIPLTKWFAAIRTLLLAPSLAVAELAQFLQIDRRQTVRNMAERIRAARDSSDATNRLAGLDELYLGQLS